MALAAPPNDCAIPEPELPGRRSRLGGDLCAGVPWLRPDVHEAPRGMLERPTGCPFAKTCAKERRCSHAEAREIRGWHEHRRYYEYDKRKGLTETATFEQWAGLDPTE